MREETKYTITAFNREEGKKAIIMKGMTAENAVEAMTGSKFLFQVEPDPTDDFNEEEVIFKRTDEFRNEDSKDYEQLVTTVPFDDDYDVSFNKRLFYGILAVIAAAFIFSISMNGGM